MQVKLQSVVGRHPAARADAPPALGPLSLDVERGEHVAVIGPSGAGKTTLLQLIACAMRAQSGELRLDGVDPWLLPKQQLQRLRGQLALAPQVPPLPPRQRVVTSVLAGRLPSMGLLASLRSLFYPSDIGAAHAALERFDVAEKLFERVDRLSGGERQRVGLSRLMVAPASLWLVDEPLSALDPARAHMATESLLRAATEASRTLIATLHQVDMALAHFPRIVGLRDGQLAFDLPRHAVTPELLSRLYAHGAYDQDGLGDATSPSSIDHPAPPAVMHCR